MMWRRPPGLERKPSTSCATWLMPGRLPKGALAGWLVGRPVDPLLAVDRAEIAPTRRERLVRDDAGLEILLRNFLAGGSPVFRQRPVAPDRHPLLQQRADVGVAGQEPQHLARGGFPEHALGSEQRNTVAGKIEAQLRAEHRAGTDPGTVDALVALLPDAPHQVEVLPLPVAVGGRAPAAHRRLRYHPKSALASGGPRPYRRASASPRGYRGRRSGSSSAW